MIYFLVEQSTERSPALSTDEHAPAERPEHASREHRADEHIDPGTFAHFAQQLFEHVADVQGADADLLLARAIAELFELSPIARIHTTDVFFVELVEELHRRGQPGQEAARMVLEVQKHWDQEA
jgi:hypothetical protein